MKSSILAILVGALLFAGCASNPATIRATYVSPLEYSNLDCDQLRLEMMRVSRRVATASGQQQEERDDDKAALAVGLILFWPALFFMGGDDMKQEIALLKGQYEALETVAIQKKCDWMLQVQDQRVELETQDQK
jgi:hypothetical protein